MIPRTFDLDGSQRKLDAARVNEALYKSRLRGWNTEISQGDDLPAFTPDRHMPIKHLVKADPVTTYGKESGVVIQKGTIVSVKSIWASSFYASNPDDLSGIDTSGDVRLGTDVFGNPIKANVMDEYAGYGSTMNGGFITIANGGVAASDLYRQVDVDYGTLDSSGNAVVVGNAYTRTANIPIGVASNTIFVDNKNRVYNMQTQILEFNSIKTDYFMIYPYVNTAVYDKVSLSVAGGDTQTKGDGYSAIDSDFVFLYGNIDHFISGKYLTSDANGNFVPQYDDTNLTDAKTVQTVGKLVLMDNRFPKEKMDEILTFTRIPGESTEAAIGVTGSDTLGIPAHLFIFAWKILNEQAGSAPSMSDIKDAIQSGNIGYAKINLHVS